MFFVIALFKVPLTFAQSESWDSVRVRAFGTNITMSGDQLTVNSTISFTVTSPPADVTEGMQEWYNNTIFVLDEESGENFTRILSPGDVVFIMKGDNFRTSTGGTSDPDIKSISYTGSANMLLVNSAIIPELSSISILTVFWIATFLVAIVYRKGKGH